MEYGKRKRGGGYQVPTRGSQIMKPSTANPRNPCASLRVAGRPELQFYTRTTSAYIFASSNRHGLRKAGGARKKVLETVRSHSISGCSSES